MRGKSRRIFGKLLCGWVSAERFHTDLIAVLYCLPSGFFFSTDKKASMMMTYQKPTCLTSSHLYTSVWVHYLIQILDRIDPNSSSSDHFLRSHGGQKSALTCAQSHYKSSQDESNLILIWTVINCSHWWKFLPEPQQHCVTAHSNKGSLCLLLTNVPFQTRGYVLGKLLYSVF